MITCNAITSDPNHYTHLQEGTIIPAWLQASVICAINCGIGKRRNSLPDLLMVSRNVCVLRSCAFARRLRCGTCTLCPLQYVFPYRIMHLWLSYI